MTRQHIVFLTGAGVSAESGLSIFRGKDGMWTNEEWVHLASTDALYNETQKCLVSIIGGGKSWPRWSRTMLTA